MNAHEYFILKLLEGNDKSFYIPVYQREYSWGEDECETLLSDLRFVVKQNLASHFFGSIVYSQRDLGGIASYCIIDGQQRITTITLLLLAIYNIFKLHDQKNPGFLTKKGIYLEKIENNFFYVDPYKKPRELKLSLTEVDSPDFNSLFETKDDLDGLNTDLRTLKTNESNIHRNYKFFYNELSKTDIDGVIGIFNSLRKLVIVNVSLEQNDDPQLIFESINSKIKGLKESDKIRNFLFMRVEYDEQKILYIKYWLKITNNVPDVSKLIRFYLAIKTNEFASERQLYYFFKSFMTINPSLQSEDILSDLLRYSEYWKKIIGFNSDSKFEYQKSMYRINKLDISTVFPLLFVCFDEMENGLDIEDMNEIMSFIESYLIRRNFLSLPIGSLNKIFAFMPAEINKFKKEGFKFKDALIRCFANKTAKARFPKDGEFKDAFMLFDLYNAKSAFKKYVLERLSNYNNKEIIDVDESINSGKLTIEHVMPQHLSEQWKNYLGPSFEQIHSKYLNTIGNLTLTAYNSEYSNLLFGEKKELSSKGFNFSSLYLNEYIKTCADWKESQIKQRAELLFERALDIWKYPYEANKDLEFCLMDPATWACVPITKFAKTAFDYMLTNNILTASDIAILKDKTLSKKELQAYYEVLTENRKPNGSKKCHWAAKEYIVYGEKLYLSFEWFEEQFNKLSEYVKAKLHL